MLGSEKVVVVSIAGVWFEIDENRELRIFGGDDQATKVLDINMVGGDDGETYELHRGVDGNWYDVNDSQTPFAIDNDCRGSYIDDLLANAKS